jgi:flagellar biosynthetic protein FlhB
MSSDQTEKASPTKRRKAADKGDRLVGRELLSAAALTAGILALGAMADGWILAWRHAYRDSLALSSWIRDRNPSEISTACRSLIVTAVYPMVWVGVVACAAALGAGVVQGGGQLKPGAVSPKWSRLSPVTNMQHLFSQQAIVRLLKSLVPVAAIAFLAWQKLAALTTLPVLSLARLPAMFQAIYDLLLSGALLMLAWSAVDFLSSWWSREKRLRMSKQDVKDEGKEAEGSPQVKGRIRRMQRQMRGRKLREDVSKATVVVTNPTHYAVALSFDFDSMEPPRVLAKGRDLLASEIREQARWAGVPLFENPLLARSLYRMVEPGQGIPFELYAAVAGILAYLYRGEVEARLRGRPPAPSPPVAVQGPGFESRAPTVHPAS